MEDLKSIRTEQRNPETMHIDELSTLDMVRLINREDHRVAEAVAHVCPQIAQAVDIIAAHLHGGGRLVYCGCVTSGRLGILDAVECPGLMEDGACSTKDQCVTKYVWKRVNDSINRTVDEIKLSQLVEESKKAIENYGACTSCQ